MHSAIFSSEYNTLSNLIGEGQYSSIFLLTDSNTSAHCSNYFMDKLSLNKPIIQLSITDGEEHKNLETCNDVWQKLIAHNADRKSLIINLGGGVVTDLGGFIAATYKRGIDFIQIPTSLLAMVDAAIGGKTGIDFNGIKNCIGTITEAKAVMVDTNYLSTLPKNQLNSGMAEVIKHALISSQSYYNEVCNYIIEGNGDLNTIIKDSIKIKEQVVKEDRFESGQRKILNFGHTLGHAIESYFLENEKLKTLLHGEAIGYGMVLECYLSQLKFDFPEKITLELAALVKSLYGSIQFSEDAISQIIDYMKYDKKNVDGKVNFVLLEDIGKPKIDCNVSNDEVLKAFDYFKKN
ncbi:MAG: 3-dehydroquinate synthase [bacterium]